MTCFNILQYMYRINIFSSLFGCYLHCQKYFCHAVRSKYEQCSEKILKEKNPRTDHPILLLVPLCLDYFKGHLLEQLQAKLSTIVTSPRVLLLITNYMGLQHTSKNVCRYFLGGELLRTGAGEPKFSSTYIQYILSRGWQDGTSFLHVTKYK